MNPVKYIITCKNEKKKHRAKSIIATLLCELKYIIIEKHLSDTNGHSANGPPYFWYKSCAL